MSRSSFWVAVCLLLTAGCAVPWIERAETAYDEGRYLEVAEDLAEHERDLDGLPQAMRVRYGLYRGLAAMKLGDSTAARRWLGYARDQDKTGNELDDKQQSQLDGGWQELAKLGLVAGHHEMPARGGDADASR